MTAWALGTDEDNSLAAVMLRLVLSRAVLPDFAAAVQVHRPQLADFAGPASGEALESHHIRHDLRQVGQRGLDERFLDGQDRGRFAGGRAAPLQPFDGRKSW